jgi:apolipoprotein D and lipocalin family protein
MRSWFMLMALGAALSVLPAAASADPSVVQVGSRHYSGTWLEIGRTPMWLTDGCVAGYTTYRTVGASQILVEDGCYEGRPGGKLKTVNGTGTLLDANAARAKLRVRYPFLITFIYWVLYESPSKDWFISADPKLRNLWIYSRRVPTKKKLALMVAKAKSLGYDVRKLEFPAH